MCEVDMARGTNPILDMDFPDPDVIRVGNIYYMAARFCSLMT